MKPPSRLRSAPARYDLGPATRIWTDREKRRLLKGLRAQAQVPGPLRPELLNKYLPSRDEAENSCRLEKLAGVSGKLNPKHPEGHSLDIPDVEDEKIMEFVDILKERVAREAVKAQYRYCQGKRKNAPIPAPIEVWTELAEKLTGCLEDAVTAAFSQVLTIASAEPLSFLHSVPPKSLEAKNPRCSSPTFRNTNKSNEETPEAAVLSNVEEQPTVENDGFQIDFEKIYNYLSVISRGSKAPELPPGESAVLLDLLLSLPEELESLDFKKLKAHMYKCYRELNARYTGDKSRTQAEANQSANSGQDLHNKLFDLCPDKSCLKQQEGASSVASSKGDEAPPSAIDWKTLGICPLNSFMFPLDLLAHKGNAVD